MDLKKQIRLSKIGNILIYFAKKTEICGVGKVNKLLYYLDCYHLEKHGRRVIQDTYKKLPEGPVPTDTYNRIKSIIELRYGTEDSPPIKNDKFHEHLMEFIDVKIEVLDAKNCVHRHRIVPKKRFDSKLFSKSELEVLEEVASEYKPFTAKRLSEKTHTEPPYKAASANEEVDLKLYAKEKVSRKRFQEIEYIENLSEAMEFNYG